MVEFSNSGRCEIVYGLVLKFKVVSRVYSCVLRMFGYGTPKTSKVVSDRVGCGVAVGVF